MILVRKFKFLIYWIFKRKIEEFSYVPLYLLFIKYKPSDLKLIAIMFSYNIALLFNFLCSENIKIFQLFILL